ncbi:MAG: acetate--CoA ligase family protein, partial [Thermodesulfobacteriota bacterium]|nr:acetate--CoA ligase family protein [Thermodesulfobacteriota bacterium]
MEDIFNPQSVVIIGVSSKEGNLGKNILKNLLNFEFKGKIYAVGRENDSIFGKKVYRSISDIPSSIDLAVILAPAKIIPATIEECGKKGVKGAVILSGGFREYGKENKDIEDALIKNAEKYNIRFVGPNCQGLINTANGLCLPFGVMNKENFPKGRVSIIAQSGNVGILAAILLSKENIGINKIVSVGNKLNIDEADLLSYFINDKQTDLIFFYLESIERGSDFIKIALKSKKPIIVYKTNLSHLSSNIAMSHTAALASDDRIVDAALKQAGIIRVKELKEFITYAKVFNIPYMKGNNIAVISGSGGFGVIAADNCSIYNFNLPTLPSRLLDEVKMYGKAKVIKLSNPLDIGDIFNTNAIFQTVKKVLELDYINGIVLSMFFNPKKEFDRFDTMFTGPDTKHIIAKLKELTGYVNKPVALNILSPVYNIDSINRTCELPLFTSPVEAVKALSASRDYFSHLHKKQGKVPQLKLNARGVEGIIKRSEKEKKLYSTPEAMEILSCYDIPVEIPEIAEDIQSAIDISNKMGYPVAMKVSSNKILHKSDIGGVIINISNDEELKIAYKKIKDNIKAPYTSPFYIQIQKMVTAGREIILGAKYDEHFGHVIMFGMGGIYVEILKDISFRLPPVSKKVALEMIREVRGSEILKGVRGETPYDILSICDALIKLSKLVIDFPRIKELDINPFILFRKG